MTLSRNAWLTIGSLVTIVVLLAVGAMMPNWLLFTLTRAMGFGLVALGIVALMRGGLVSFGQGLIFCASAYTSGLLARHTGITDVFVLLVVGAVTGIVAAALVAPLIARYRGIFFAMLTLALSMVLYGVLAKMTVIGGSDGFNVPEVTYLGWLPSVLAADYALYAVSAVLSVVAAILCRCYFDSMGGLISLAVRENELRVEYLGTSVFRLTVRNFVIAGLLAGLGGTLNGVALGHVDPFFAYWTTSGEFVFIAILAGHISVVAPFLAALVLELIRSFSNVYFPEIWQLLLGTFLLLVIFFVPGGLGSLWGRFMPADAAPQTKAKEPAATESRSPAE